MTPGFGKPTSRGWPRVLAVADQDILAHLRADAADVADRVDTVLFDLQLQRVLDGDLDSLRASLDEIFHQAPDLVAQRFRTKGGLSGLVVFVTSAVDQALLARGVLERLADSALTPPDGWAPDLLARVGEGIAPAGQAARVSRVSDVADAVLEGAAVLAFAGCREALAIRLERLAHRPVEQSTNEPVVIGPHDAMIEDVETNISLIRRRLRTPRLWLDRFHIGRVSHTAVYVLHLRGIADDRLVAEVRRRLGRIDMDGVIESNQIKEQIRDTPSSPFPTAQRTERPDRVAAALLEGRAAILTDGSPLAIIVPAPLTMLLSSAEDYYLHWTVSTAVRAVRWFALLLGLLLPAFYVAISTYHQEFIPSSLLLTLAASRENVPMPTLAEVLVLLILFEIIREASVRVPQGIGNALTIGGTLVVGQAAVRAGVISSPIIIVTATVVIAFLVIPNYELVQVSRLVLYPLLLAAGFFGIYGLFFVGLVILVHLASLRSFGVEYLAPLAPVRRQQWHDFVWRAPWYRMRSRPVKTGYANRTRNRTPSPRPRRRRSA